MKRLILGLLAAALVIGGLYLALAPAVDNQLRLWRDARAVNAYREAVAGLDTLACGERLARARDYNASLDGIALSDAFAADYAWGEDPGAEVLDVTGLGVIAVLELPKLGVTLPVYRGASEGGLERAVVHLEGTSLPVGGVGSECVLAGKGGGRFDDLVNGLDRMIPGDLFTLRTLQDALAYEVEAVETLSPDALGPIEADAEVDGCTLMTTARVNGEAQRLLVRARRVSRRAVPLEDDTQLLPGWAAGLIFAVPLLLAGLAVLALIELLRRAAGRHRIRKMKL